MPKTADCISLAAFLTICMSLPIIQSPLKVKLLYNIINKQKDSDGNWWKLIAPPESSYYSLINRFLYYFHICKSFIFTSCIISPSYVSLEMLKYCKLALGGLGLPPPPPTHPPISFTAWHVFCFFWHVRVPYQHQNLSKEFLMPWRPYFCILWIRIHFRTISTTFVNLINIYYHVPC